MSYDRDGVNKAGLPPGTLTHVGEVFSDRCVLYQACYDENVYDEKTSDAPDDLPQWSAQGKVKWLHVSGLQDTALIETVGERFGIHPLVLEDILNTSQRPKAEEFENYSFITFKRIFSSDAARGSIVLRQFSIIVMADTVISFQESADDFLAPLKERIRDDKGRIRKMGAGYLAYSIMDFIIDHYFGLLEQFGEQTDDVEEMLADEPTDDVLRKTHALKRVLITARKSVWPLRDVVAGLSRGGGDIFGKECQPYLRDLHDHVIQIMDSFETMRDVVSGLLDLYLSSLSNKMNAVMKVLTIIATIFIPLTFIAGIYGMNFENMPELKWRYGYAAVWGLMLFSAGVMVWLFKRKRWL